MRPSSAALLEARPTRVLSSKEGAPQRSTYAPSRGALLDHNDLVGRSVLRGLLLCLTASRRFNPQPWPQEAGGCPGARRHVWSRGSLQTPPLGRAGSGTGSLRQWRTIGHGQAAAVPASAARALAPAPRAAGRSGSGRG